MNEKIRIKVSGEGLSPANLNYKKLHELITLYFKSLVSYYSDIKNEPIAENLARYSLIRIEKGSVDLEFAVDKQLRNTNDGLVNDLKLKTYERISDSTRRNFSEMGKVLESNDIPLAIELFSGADIIVQLFPKDLEYSPLKYSTIGYLYGELTDVGGATNPNVHLSTRLGNMTCSVTKEQAKELATRLYTIVGLQCSIKWTKGDARPAQIVVNEILPYDESSWEADIKHLQTIFTNRFKDASLTDFLSEVRGRDE